ncbi:MAG: TatD family hydrolase [Candidatus Bipolaricaulota bacterium]
MKPKLIDTHAHANMGHYDDDRVRVINRARQAGVAFLNMGLDLPSSYESIELASEYDNVYAGTGFHPHEADALDASALKELARASGAEEVKAIGEIGLDYYRENSPKEDQRRAFRAQLDLAVEAGLPVSIHNRDSTKDLLKILHGREDLPSGVIHSFFGDRGLGEEFIDLGFHLGLSGPVTFDGEGELRSAVRDLPLDRLVLETDSPFLTPEPNRGKRNEPGYVEFVAKKVADIKGLTPEKVARMTTNNARRVFDLDEY